MAYALHNEAEAAHNTADFLIVNARFKIDAVDQVLSFTEGVLSKVRYFSQDTSRDKGIQR